MKTTKISLATLQGKLSRAEMKNIMAGTGEMGPDCHFFKCYNGQTGYACGVAYLNVFASYCPNGGIIE